MPRRRNNADIYRTISVLFCVFLFVFVSRTSAQFKPCEETGHGNVNIGNNSTDIKHVKILEMPEALYPETARNAGVFGTVSLKVRFLAGGRIGWITVVSGLPEGLSEESIKAARKIRFVPARQNGRMINLAEIVEYHFSDPGKCHREH